MKEGLQEIAEKLKITPSADQEIQHQLNQSVQLLAKARTVATEYKDVFSG